MFWLSIVKKIKRPIGPISSIPIKMDSILKHYFDRYRKLRKLPPMKEGEIYGKISKDIPKTLKHD